MGRAPCCDKANVKKGPWSPEEDAKLKDYIEKFGTGGNWIALPQKAGLKRCGKSCRLRWLNYLRPNIKHGEFSDDEDRIICSLYASIGSRWSIIAAQLPGRTDNDIKNYWNTKLKKKLMMGNIINNNIITPNSSIINPKKSLNPYHYHYPNYSSMFHNHQFNHQYPSSSLLSNLVISTSPSPSPSFQCTNSTLEYNTTTTPSNLSSSSSMNMSFTHPAGYKSSSNDDDLILMQNYQVKDNSTLLVFGAHDNHHHQQHQHHHHHHDHHQQHQHHQVHQPSCSSDGSCSVVVTPPVKVEDHHQNYGNFSNGVVHHHHHHHQQQEEGQGITRSGDDDHHHHDASSDHHHNNNNMKVMVGENVGLWGQNGQSTSGLDYGLEEIKQLISTTNYFDDIKAPEKDIKFEEFSEEKWSVKWSKKSEKDQGQ